MENEPTKPAQRMLTSIKKVKGKRKKCVDFLLSNFDFLLASSSALFYTQPTSYNRGGLSGSWCLQRCTIQLRR
jgi:hypothetical protein